ncbi:MAG: hypothetical protein WC479_09645 [Candidatus Izemoplasmatales bacterium]
MNHEQLVAAILAIIGPQYQTQVSAITDDIYLSNLLRDYKNDPSHMVESIKAFKPVSSSSDTWQVSKWLNSDGTVTDTQTDKTIGYYDKSGVPQSLDSSLLPEQSYPEPSTNPTDSYGNTAYIQLNGKWQQNPSYVDPYTQEQQSYTREQQAAQLRLQQNAQMMDQLNYQNSQTQGYRDYNQMRQQQADSASEGLQRTYDAQMQAWNDTLAGLSGPSDWLKYWKTANNPPAMKKIDDRGGFNTDGLSKPNIAANAEEAAAKGFTSWVTPDQWQGASANGFTSGFVPQYNEFGGVSESPWTSGNGIYQGRMKVYDSNAGGLRWETDDEWNRRTVTDPLNDIKYGANPGIQTYVDPMNDQTDNTELSRMYQGFVATNHRLPTEEELSWYTQNQSPSWSRQRDVGPKLPTWAAAFNTPTQQVRSGTVNMPGWASNGTFVPGETQVDVNKLTAGNYNVNPVSQQTWNSMSPTQQSGLQGMVNAAGTDWNDYLADAQNSWAKPGTAVARKRTAVY